MSVTWYGDTFALKSRHEHVSSDGTFEVTITYEGAMDQLRANSPYIGNGIDGYVNVYVEDIKLESLGLADKGVMHVAASDRLIRTVDEIEWVRVDQDIKRHPIFMPGGISVLTDDDRKAVDLALDNPDTTYTITLNAYNLYYRLLNGETNYAAYIPLARRSSWFLSFPTTSSVGYIQSPPMAVPGGYTWVITADKANRRGNYWERTFEWTGFSQVDTVIINNA